LKHQNSPITNANNPPAVIAGAFQTGVLGVRSLKRQGINAICFDCNKSLQGFSSTYGPARLSPNPDTHPEQWIEFMKTLSKELGQKAVLIPSSDRYVTAIAQHRKALEEYYLISPGIELQGLLAEKQTQYRLAAENGMPMPLTRRISSMQDLLKLSDELTYPCLIKPWHFREWEQFPLGHPLSYQKIIIVNSEPELIARYNLAKEVNPDVIIQDIIQGPDTAKRVYLACYDKNSNRIANAMFRELRCVPFGFGPASVSEPVDDPEADEVCDAFLKKIGYVGICEIEVKRDIRDGKVKLIEANPRLSGGGDAAPYAGVDLCWIYYQNMIGAHITPVTPSGKKFKHIVLRAEATAIPVYMRAGLLSWKDLIQSYKPPVAFFDVDWRDWKNSLETILVFMWTLVSNFIRSNKFE